MGGGSRRYKHRYGGDFTTEEIEQYKTLQKYITENPNNTMITPIYKSKLMEILGLKVKCDDVTILTNALEENKWDIVSAKWAIMAEKNTSRKGDNRKGSKSCRKSRSKSKSRDNGSGSRSGSRTRTKSRSKSKSRDNGSRTRTKSRSKSKSRDKGSRSNSKSMQ